MTSKTAGGPRVPVDRPDREAAGRDPGPGAKDRPGFDLGGAKEPANKEGAGLTPGGPKGTAASGATGSGRSDGATDPKGSRSGPTGPAR